MKRCRHCGEEKPLEDFHCNKNNKDGHTHVCKPCAKDIAARWRKDNPEKKKEQDRLHHQRNRDKRLAARREYYRSDPERWKAKERDRQQALKHEAFQAYGGYRCSCCGEEEPMFLCLDHVNNDGNQHRREIGGAERLYQWLRVNDYPRGLLQVLCFNCNQGKRLNGGTCPHQGKKLMKAVHDIDILETTA